jgi:hypothetical protein
MTYSLQAVTSWQDVVDEIITFAAARGWTTTGGSGSSGTVENPSTGLVTTLTASSDTITASPAGGIEARARSPYLDGTYPGSPVIVNPVQCHLFGNNSPYAAPDSEPYIAVVVGFGYNSYRHIYIGTMVPAGNYTDGDVISINNFSLQGSSPGDIYPYGQKNKYLFGANNNHEDGATYAGGVKISHADNATTWRSFRSPSISSAALENLTGSEAFGGNNDDINDGRVYRAHADYASGQLMVPVNLYCSDGDDGENYRIRPLGHVSGARLIDMENVDPEQEFSISSDDWKAFPEFSKRSDAFVDWPGTAYFPNELSGYYGLAYHKDG